MGSDISIEFYSYIKMLGGERAIIPTIMIWGAIGGSLTTLSVPLMLFSALSLTGSIFATDYQIITSAPLIDILIGALIYPFGIIIQKSSRSQIEAYWSYLEEKIPELEVKPKEKQFWDKYYHILMFIPFVCISTMIYPSLLSRVDIYQAAADQAGKQFDETAEVLEDLIRESRIPSNKRVNTAFSHFDNANGLIHIEERAESDGSSPTVHLDQFITAYQEAQRARDLAEQQTELLDEIEPIGELVDSNLPDEHRKEASEKLETARFRIAQGRYEEARELANEAEEIAKSTVDHLIDEGDSFANEASRCHEQGEHADAIDRWEEALDAYNEALSLAPDMDKNDRVPDIRESIADTERNRNRSRMYDIVREGQNQIEDAEQALGEDEYEQAIKAYENALSIHTRAHEIAGEHGFEKESRLADSLASIEERLQASRVRRIEAAFSEANALLKDDEHAAAEERFEELIDGIDETAIDDKEVVDSLRESAQEGHLEAQVEQGREKHQEAVRKYEQREYYEAPEAFEDVREFLKPVLSLASKYGFPDKKEDVLRLHRLCEVNADEARQALYETGTVSSDLSSIDDIEEGLPPQTGSRPAAQDGRPTRKPADKLASQSGNDLPDSHGELRSFTDDKPAHEKLERLGGGSDSVVWKVELSDSGEIAALKEAFLGPETIPIEDVKRFLTTSKMWSDRDDHPHIVSVYGFGYDARPWLLIEYMPEGSLRQYIGEIPVADGIEHIANIADALAYTRGADHHDIKPDNILLSTEKQAKLADWELAKIAFRHEDKQTGISPPYAAPEQFDRSRGPLDDRTDVYQLGVTTYELLTGELPYDPSTPDFEQRVLEGQPQLPSEINPRLSSEIDRIILRAMAADRDERYEKANEFRNDLREVQNTITSSE